jgi:hypothetical protein
MIKAKPDISDEELKSLTTLITEPNSIPTFRLLLLDARKALDETSHALAIIYSITALESVARQYFERIAIGSSFFFTLSHFLFLLASFI